MYSSLFTRIHSIWPHPLLLFQFVNLEKYIFSITPFTFFLVDNSHIWILKCKVALLSTSYTRKEEKEQSTFEWMIRHKFDDGLRFKVTHNEISCKFRNMGSEVRGCKACVVNYLDITKFTSPLTSIKRAFNLVW